MSVCTRETCQSAQSMLHLLAILEEQKRRCNLDSQGNAQLLVVLVAIEFRNIGSAFQLLGQLHQLWQDQLARPTPALSSAHQSACKKAGKLPQHGTTYSSGAPVGVAVHNNQRAASLVKERVKVVLRELPQACWRFSLALLRSHAGTHACSPMHTLLPQQKPWLDKLVQKVYLITPSEGLAWALSWSSCLASACDSPAL